MPCNSDYMNPSPKEIKRLSEKEGRLKGITDGIVSSSDMLREFALNKSIDNRSFRAIAKPFVDGAYAVIKSGDALCDEIRGEYAFNGYHTGVLDAFKRASSEYESVIDIVAKILKGDKPPKELFDKIEKDQVEHRKGDISRLIKVFTDKGDFATVATLASVDFTKPLESQIGFDPDAY